MNSSQLVARNARKYPKSEAIISPEGSLTYKELDEKVNQLAHGLVMSGITKGDRVCLFMPNTPEFIISYFAIQRIGAIVVPVNAKFTLDEVQYIINHSEAKGLIAHEMVFSAVEKIFKVALKIKTGKKAEGWLSFESYFELSSPEEIGCTLTEDNHSTILYTSGTTGDPKELLS